MPFNTNDKCCADCTWHGCGYTSNTFFTGSVTNADGTFPAWEQYEQYGLGKLNLNGDPDSTWIVPCWHGDSDEAMHRLNDPHIPVEAMGSTIYYYPDPSDSSDRTEVVPCTCSCGAHTARKAVVQQLINLSSGSVDPSHWNASQ